MPELAIPYQKTHSTQASMNVLTIVARRLTDPIGLELPLLVGLA